MRGLLAGLILACSGCTVTADLSRVTAATTSLEAAVSSSTTGALDSIRDTSTEARGMVADLRSSVAEMRSATRVSANEARREVLRLRASVDDGLREAQAPMIVLTAHASHAVASVDSLASTLAAKAETPVLREAFYGLCALLVGAIVLVVVVQVGHVVVYWIERRQAKRQS